MVEVKANCGFVSHDEAAAPLVIVVSGAVAIVTVTTAGTPAQPA